MKILQNVIICFNWIIDIESKIHPDSEICYIIKLTAVYHIGAHGFGSHMTILIFMNLLMIRIFKKFKFLVFNQLSFWSCVKITVAVAVCIWEVGRGGNHKDGTYSGPSLNHENIDFDYSRLARVPKPLYMKHNKALSFIFWDILDLTCLLKLFKKCSHKWTLFYFCLSL